MDAPTSWGDLALCRPYLLTVARSSNVPPHHLDDIVSAATVDLLNREEKGQRFPGAALAAKSAVVDAIRVSVREARRPDELAPNRRELSPEDEATLEQIEEWRGLTDAERRKRAHEARVALGTSLTPATVVQAASRMVKGR